MENVVPEAMKYNKITNSKMKKILIIFVLEIKTTPASIPHNSYLNLTPETLSSKTDCRVCYNFIEFSYSLFKVKII